MTDRGGRGVRRRRSAARLAAVQVLYGMEVGQTGAETALLESALGRLPTVEDGVATPDPDPEFLGELVRGVTQQRQALDACIDAALTGGVQVERLDVILRAILRTGACELKTRPDIPAKVVITEYLDVAHAFFAGNEPTLVNAVLDRLAGRLRDTDGAS